VKEEVSFRGTFEPGKRLNFYRPSDAPHPSVSSPRPAPRPPPSSSLPHGEREFTRYAASGFTV